MSPRESRKRVHVVWILQGKDVDVGGMLVVLVEEGGVDDGKVDLAVPAKAQ
jgi:hypothetical protein